LLIQKNSKLKIQSAKIIGGLDLDLHPKGRAAMFFFVAPHRPFIRATL
jgi:hypothetical protein